jgi:hypothetical protein
MSGANRALLEADKHGHAIRIFQGVTGHVVYQGKFTLDAEESCYTADAPETAGGPCAPSSFSGFAPSIQHRQNQTADPQ